MKKDYYQILGVSKDASPEDIKRAFYKLAHKYHPDKGGDEQKFKEINEAYQTLSDQKKREQYDKFGTTFEGAQGPAGGESGFSGFEWAWGRPESFDSEFDFGDLEDVLENMFGGGFGGATRSRRKKDSRRGKDIEVDLEINLDDTLSGKETEINLYKFNTCPRCQGNGAEPGTKTKECFSCRGTGQVQQIRKTFLGSFTQYVTCPVCEGLGYIPEKPCNVCRGEGRVKSEEKIKIFVPAGVDTNQVIKVEGKGEAGKTGGKSGDLYVRIFIKRHPLFQRKGDDLYISLPISYAQAVLGNEIEIPNLEKTKILMLVPAGTESGKVLRISGKGIPHFSGFGRGNLYVKLVIKTPKNLTKRQKELLERMREEGL
ncbi:MAG: molecular chaperone DnaJ [Candidatus Pacebacteria bacterium]|nr:molecular chaperone DnaJ [Candidatus Paceibacterota bacterium]